jgi:choline-sulfatase
VTPANLLIVLSDEHNPKLLGAAGTGLIRTPNLDALATRGTRFSAAYTPCPICDGTAAARARALGQR